MVAAQLENLSFVLPEKHTRLDALLINVAHKLSHRPARIEWDWGLPRKHPVGAIDVEPILLAEHTKPELRVMVLYNYEFLACC